MSTPAAAIALLTAATIFAISAAYAYYHELQARRAASASMAAPWPKSAPPTPATWSNRAPRRAAFGHHRPAGDAGDPRRRRQHGRRRSNRQPDRRE